MAFPGPFPDNTSPSLRVFSIGTGTTVFSGNQIEFTNPATGEQAWAQAIRVKATGGTIQFSFDGTNVHGQVADGEDIIYWDRRESAISLRGNGVTFLVEAW